MFGLMSGLLVGREISDGIPMVLTKNLAGNHIHAPNIGKLIHAENHEGREHVGGKVKSQPLAVVVAHFGKHCVDDDDEEEEECRGKQDVGVEVELGVIILPGAHLDLHGFLLKTKLL